MNRHRLFTQFAVHMFISTLIYIRTISPFLLVYHPGSRRSIKELRIELLISNFPRDFEKVEYKGLPAVRLRNSKKLLKHT
jgi:hypothetical protein